MAQKIRVKRGTRSQLNTAASSGLLAKGEPYLIDDEDRFAIGLSTTTYKTIPKTPHIGDTAPSNPAPGDYWFESDGGLLYIYFDDGSSAQWVAPLGGSGGGGGGGSGVVAKVKASFSSTGVMTLAGAENVSAVVRTAPGCYRIDFASAIPPGCVLGRASGRFNTLEFDTVMVVGTSRRSSEGVTTTHANILIMSGTTAYDPYANGTDGSWFYVEIIDPTVNLI